MSDNAKPFEPQRRVHIFQPNHNTTKTQTHDNQTIGTKRQHKQSHKGAQQEPHQRDRIGHSEWFVHPCNKKSKDTTRILFHNVNGLELSTESLTTQLLCKFIAAEEVDIYGIAETNTNWRHKQGRKKLKRITSKYWNRDRIITSKCTLDWKSLHKSGGTTTIVRQPIKHSIVSTNSDPDDLGRWNSFTIRGKNNP